MKTSERTCYHLGVDGNQSYGLSSKRLIAKKAEKVQRSASNCRWQVGFTVADSSQFSAASHRTRIKVVPLLPPTFCVICSQILRLIRGEKNEEKYIL
jgi:hypothetical protein